VLEVIVGEDGCTEGVRVARKISPTLDQLAKETVSSWKFSPATRNGKPVKVLVQIEIKFKDGGK
jgi:TonB family protein